MMKAIKKYITLILALCCVLPFFLVAACNEKNHLQNSVFSSELSSDPSNDPSNDLSNGNSDSNSADLTPPDSSSPPSASESKPNNSSKPQNSSSANSSSSQTTVKPISTKVSYIRCTGDSVNIRAGASTSDKVLGAAKQGTMYAVIEQKNGWYKTYYRNQTAYLYASYATVFTLEKHKNESVEDVIEEGYKLIGIPYVYGAVRLHDGKGNLLKGFSNQKFDCSSLIQYIFYRGAGKVLNTTTRTQIKQGTYVAKDKLQRGDCLFFTNEERQYNTGIERVGHVALYLGDNYILHTASDYARIEKISAYRWNFYIEARRFI
ncbi:MAG: C40 family peptidase [Clostridia bacterium]|nr:C40 family peptidase [Clostridia bacterium]